MTTPRATGQQSGVVTVRYWAAIKAAAGRPEEVVDVAGPSTSGSTVADVLDVLRGRHADNARFAQVLSVCTLLIDERPIGSGDPAAVRVEPGALLDVLPPFAGG